MIFETEDQKIEFDIPKEYTKIEVHCSGGADSTLMLFLTVKQLEEENRDASITIISGGDSRFTPYPLFSTRIIGWIKKYFKTQKIYQHHIVYPKMSEKRRGDALHYLETKLFLRGDIQFKIDGTTKNPSIGLVEGANGEIINIAEAEDRATQRDNPDKILYGATTNHPATYFPMRNVDKRMTAHIYKELDIMELFDITYSCECLHADMTNNFRTHCGECYWCLERKWAFGKL